LLLLLTILIFDVKIRGYRVELSEIESVIMEVGAEDIQSAVVDVRGDRLVGFVVLRVKNEDEDTTQVGCCDILLLDNYV
jgi:acyl-coenzyme A synthetase/AMP-(fatty) acid ligase